MITAVLVIMQSHRKIGLLVVKKMITILYRRKPKRNPAMEPRITKLIFLNYF
jgi:hypothetical protein